MDSGTGHNFDRKSNKRLLGANPDLLRRSGEKIRPDGESLDKNELGRQALLVEPRLEGHVGVGGSEMSIGVDTSAEKLPAHRIVLLEEL